MPDDIHVILRCPACAYEWFFAILRPGTWWSAGVTPEAQAKLPYCPKCQQPPPMQVVGTEAQPSLF